MKWFQVLLMLIMLAIGTFGIVLMDLGNFTDKDLCNGWVCVGPIKAFHLGELMALAGLWSSVALLFKVWSNE